MPIDIGFGDAVYPAAQEMSYPTILNFPAPSLRIYPRETVVAEKLDAMVFLGTVNSRMKDFYDIWLLTRQFEFSGTDLAAAIAKTSANRGTALDANPIALTESFTNAEAARNQWTAFLRRSSLVSLVDAPATLEEIRGPDSMLHEHRLRPTRKACVLEALNPLEQGPKPATSLEMPSTCNHSLEDQMMQTEAQLDELIAKLVALERRSLENVGEMKWHTSITKAADMLEQQRQLSRQLSRDLNLLLQAYAPTDATVAAIGRRATNDDPQAALNALRALEILGSNSPEHRDGCVSAICDALGRFSLTPLIRAAILFLSMLKSLQEPRVIEVTDRLLESNNHDIWGATAIGLGKQGDKRAIPHLIRLLEAKNKDAQKILIAFKGSRFLWGSHSPRRWNQWWIDQGNRSALVDDS